MTPVPDPQGWGRTDGLLVRQPVRAEARRLFIGSGSLTWFRRPRLASPELTAEVEANHPQVESPPTKRVARWAQGLVKVQPFNATGPRRPTRTKASRSAGSTAPTVRPSCTTSIT